MADEQRNQGQPAETENNPTSGAGEQKGKVTFTPEQQAAIDAILEARLNRQRTNLEKQAEKTLNERVQAVEAQLKAAELKALRLEVATAKGLPQGLVDRLRGETREELEADAEVLAGLIPKTPAAQTPAGKPDKLPTSPANPAGGGGLTREQIRGMSTSEINARWEDVQRALKGA